MGVDNSWSHNYIMEIKYFNIICRTTAASAKHGWFHGGGSLLLHNKYYIADSVRETGRRTGKSTGKGITDDDGC